MVFFDDRAKSEDMSLAKKRRDGLLMLPTSYGRLVCLRSAGLRQSSVLGLTLWSANSLGSVLFLFGAGGSYYAAGCGFGVCWTSGRCVMHYIRIRLTPS